MKQLKGSLLLLIAALIWGTAFVAQSSAAENVGSFTFNAARSLVGFVFLLAFLAICCSARKEPLLPSCPKDKKHLIIAGICCGAVLFSAMSFQQFGIALYPDGVASSGRSGFLTAMYVVIVALAGKLSGKKLHPAILLAAAIAVGGMYFLCLSGGISQIYFGDLLGLICAFCFAGHILVIAKFSDVDGVKMSCIQFLTCGILSSIAMFIFEKPNISDITAATIPILYTGVMSSGIAYTLQILGQKNADPAVASIVMSLESVFAGLGGWLILSEQLNARELFGCVLVFVAVILAQIPEFISESKSKTT